MATRKEITITRRAMACDFSVTFPAEVRCALEAGCAALDEVERVEAKLSAYRQDSDLTYMNRHAWETAVGVDQELFSLLTMSARLVDATGGAFDPATGALIKTWGFFRPPRRVPSDAQRHAALASCGMARVELDCARQRVRYLCPNLEINLGGIGKGYAIDHALDSIGARPVRVQGGQSSIKAIGRFREASRMPYVPPTDHDGPVPRSRAGDIGGHPSVFFQGGRRYGHVLDPGTGWPADTLASATAIAPPRRRPTPSQPHFSLWAWRRRALLPRAPGNRSGAVDAGPAGPPRIALSARRMWRYSNEDNHKSLSRSASNRHRMAVPVRGVMEDRFRRRARPLPRHGSSCKPRWRRCATTCAPGPCPARPLERRGRQILQRPDTALSEEQKVGLAPSATRSSEAAGRIRLVLSCMKSSEARGRPAGMSEFSAAQFLKSACRAVPAAVSRPGHGRRRPRAADRESAQARIDARYREIAGHLSATYCRAAAKLRPAVTGSKTSIAATLADPASGPGWPTIARCATACAPIAAARRPFTRERLDAGRRNST